MINGYLYFLQGNTTVDSLTIKPMQESGSISVLKLTLGKNYYGGVIWILYVYQKKADRNYANA